MWGRLAAPVPSRTAARTRLLCTATAVIFEVCPDRGTLADGWRSRANASDQSQPLCVLRLIVVPLVATTVPGRVASTPYAVTLSVVLTPGTSLKALTATFCHDPIVLTVRHVRRGETANASVGSAVASKATPARAARQRRDDMVRT